MTSANLWPLPPCHFLWLFCDCLLCSTMDCMYVAPKKGEKIRHFRNPELNFNSRARILLGTSILRRLSFRSFARSISWTNAINHRRQKRFRTFSAAQLLATLSGRKEPFNRCLLSPELPQLTPLTLAFEWIGSIRESERREGRGEGILNWNLSKQSKTMADQNK